MVLSLAASTAISAALGGCVAILVTLAIERLGGHRGGIVGSLPTTIVAASFSIILASPTDAAARAALFTVPLGNSLNSVFLLCWRVVPRVVPERWALGPRLATVTVINVAVWLSLALGVWLGVGWARTKGVSSTTLGPIATACALLGGVIACISPPPAPKGSKRAPLLSVLARGLLAACSVGTANVLARTGSDVAAGLAAVFPSIYLSSMVTLWISQGTAVPTGAAGPMMLGSVSVSVFAMASGLLVEHLPLPALLLVAWIVAVGLVSVPSHKFIQWRHRATTRAVIPMRGGLAVSLSPKHRGMGISTTAELAPLQPLEGGLPSPTRSPSPSPSPLPLPPAAASGPPQTALSFAFSPLRVEPSSQGASAAALTPDSGVQQQPVGAAA